ncbi:MAG: FeoB-associated Cys-rich membrane protein [Oscillospiraceae bacterium]|nr:FeoB-associated Cys-rich membrane protein [Candidatus Equicaccousia limihippi]
MQFIFDNIWCIIVGALVAAALVFAVIKILSDRKKGKGCGGGCEGCAFSDNCHKKTDEK